MGSGKKFVPNGVFLRCSKGTMFPKFNVTPKRVLLYGEQMATELDIVPMLNIPSFGLCTVTKYCPPCMPIPTMWQGVCSDNIYVAFGRPLLEDSTMQCALSGKIEIMFTLPRFSSIASLLWNVSAFAQGIADIAGDIEDAAGEIADAAGKVADYARKAEFGLKVVAVVAAVAGVVCLATGVGAAAAPFLFSAANVAYRASTVAGKVAKAADKVQASAQKVQQAAGKVRDVAHRTSLVSKAAGDFAFDPSLKTGADLAISVLDNVKLPERKKKSKKLNAVDENQKKKSGGGTAGEVKNEGDKKPKREYPSKKDTQKVDKEKDKEPKLTREEAVGRTPSKKSKTGREVIQRMCGQGKIKCAGKPGGGQGNCSQCKSGEVKQFKDKNTGEFHDISKADMGHQKSAVQYWNEDGYKHGAKSPEVRKFMLDSDNYELEMGENYTNADGKTTPGNRSRGGGKDADGKRLTYRPAAQKPKK